MCPPESAGTDSNRIAASSQDNLFTSVYAAQDAGSTQVTARPPLRYVRDLDPIYSYVAVDVRRNEVLMQDHNTWTIRVFDRLDNTPRNATRTEPKRVIGGPKTHILFNSCLYIDPKNGDIYTVENDVGDSVEVFSEDAEGNAEPARRLEVPHRAYALAADEGKQELYISVQHPPSIEVYRKTASGNEKPLRTIQ